MTPLEYKNSRVALYSNTDDILEKTIKQIQSKIFLSPDLEFSYSYATICLFDPGLRDLLIPLVTEHFRSLGWIVLVHRNPHNTDTFLRHYKLYELSMINSFKALFYKISHL